MERGASIEEAINRSLPDSSSPHPIPRKASVSIQFYPSGYRKRPS